jgi:hypothetical protein
MIKQKIIITILILKGTMNMLIACSCNTPTIENNIKNSDVIVLAKVISIERINVENKDLKQGQFKITITKTIVDIEQKFKGNFRKKKVVFYSGNERGNCGFFFEIGERYTIFGYREGRLLSSYDFGLPKKKSSFWTDVCTRTRKYNIEEYESIVKAFKK